MILQSQRGPLVNTERCCSANGWCDETLPIKRTEAGPWLEPSVRGNIDLIQGLICTSKALRRGKVTRTQQR